MPSVKISRLLQFSISLREGENVVQIQPVWIRMRRRVTRRLIQIQAVKMWLFGHDEWAKSDFQTRAYLIIELLLNR